MAISMQRRPTPHPWGRAEQANIPWVIVIGAFALVVVMIVLKETGASDADTDYISMSILIGAFALASTLNRRTGLVVAVLAGVIAAIVPGGKSLTDIRFWDSVFRFCFLIGMSMSFYRVIVALRDREDRLQRQLADLQLLRQEVTALHALTARVPVDRPSVYGQIVQAARRLGRGSGSRLRFRTAASDEWAIVAQSSRGDDVTREAADAAAGTETNPYTITATAPGSETIAIPLATTEGGGLLQLDRDAGAMDTREVAQLLMVYARDAALTLEHVALQERLEYLAALEERGRIARDLHDGLVQSLAGIALHLEYYRDELDPSASTLHAGFDAMEAAVSGALDEARAMILGLRTELSPEDLPHALCALVDRVRSQTGLTVAADITDTVLPLSIAQINALYQVAREALNNVANHAKTDRAMLILSIEPNRVALRITDEGCGFVYPGEPADGQAAHFGLVGMGERAAKHGGDLHVTTGPGAGTIITLTFPLLSSEAER